jgi:hypothetical protein
VTIAVGAKLRNGCTSAAAHLHPRRFRDTVAAHMKLVPDETSGPLGKKCPVGDTSDVHMKKVGLGRRIAAPLEELPLGGTNDTHMTTAVGEGDRMCLGMRMRFDGSCGMSKQSWLC